MTGYVSQYVPIELAVARIAKHFHGGDEIAAWEDLAPAIKEGAITKRPDGVFHTKRDNRDDMLSEIVGRSLGIKARKDDQGLESWPEETWRRRELEEIYGQIFTEDDGTAPPDEQDEAREPDGEQEQLSQRDQRKQETVTMRDRWYDRSQEFKVGNKSFTPLGICKLIVKKEKADGYRREVTAETIKRRLNEDHPGWAD